MVRSNCGHFLLRQCGRGADAIGMKRMGGQTMPKADRAEKYYKYMCDYNLVDTTKFEYRSIR